MAYTGNLSGRVGANLLRLRKNVIKRVFESVIDTTPVDTGMLKANWHVAKGEGKESTPSPALDPSGAVTKQAMAQAVETIVDNKDGTISMSNSAGYANTIEYDGHSHTKAPNGMVRVNLVQVVKIIEEEARKL